MTEEVQKVENTKSAEPVVAKAKKSKRKRQVSRGIAHVLVTYNNTLVSITDPSGNVLATASAGQAGFKGPKKATPYAAGIIVKNLCEKIKLYGLKEVDVRVKGVGVSREAAVRALYANGLQVLSIKDITPIAHNGCRPRKPRRV